MPHPDAERLRQLAEDLRAQAKEAEEAGAAEMARGYLTAAERIDEARWTLQGLLAANRSANVQDVNAVDARRGAAIALSRLDATDTKRAALVGRWKSLRRAAKALGVSPASLVAYLDGTTPCPWRVARIAEREAGIAPADWSSVVD